MINKRFKEPSTWVGIGTLLLAVDKIFDVNEAAIVGSDVVAAASSGGGIYTVISVAIASLLGIFLREKGK